MDITTRNFFRLLRAGAFNTEEQIEPISAWKWKRIYQFALMHGVSALMYDGIKKCGQQFFMQLPEGLNAEWENSTHEIETQNSNTTRQALQLIEHFNRQQLRPILLNAQALAHYYDHPDHRLSGNIEIFFPFDTQGKKADEWALANGQQLNNNEKYVLSYVWNGTNFSHCHRMMRLTNKLHNYALQNIIEKNIRENQPTTMLLNGIRIETPSPTLELLLCLLRITRYMLNDGISLKHIVDLGIFLRKAGDKVDYVLLQEWIDKLKLSRMAYLSGALLVELFDFTTDEIPFMPAGGRLSIARILQELFKLQRPQKEEWYFQQGKDMFVHTVNSSAMFWQVRHSARYFRYYPSESFTNLFSAFAHSLSHIEE